LILSNIIVVAGNIGLDQQYNAELETTLAVAIA
jgi:hypothetical protein